MTLLSVVLPIVLPIYVFKYCDKIMTWYLSNASIRWFEPLLLHNTFSYPIINVVSTTFMIKK